MMKVPEGWKLKKLGNFIDFKNGINAEKKAYGQGIKFVNVMDIFKNDTLKASSIQGSVSATEKQIHDYSVLYGDILFNRTSETDHEIAMSAIYLCDEPAVFGGFVIRGRQTLQLLDTQFSVFCFQSNNIRQKMIRLGQGAVRANIGQKDLSKVIMLIPPLREQQKIAEILSTWDKAIKTQESLIKNSEAIKKSLMQQLLTGKKRLKGFSGAWEEVRLADVSEISKGKALSSKNLILGKYPVIAGGKTSPYTHNQYTHENIITVSASGAYAGYVALHMQKIWASDCSVIQSNKKTYLNFIFQFLCLNQNKLYSLQSGGAQPHIYPKDIAGLKLNLPTLPEQNAIAVILSDADKEIDLQKQKLEILKQEKSALMQQLLTGKKRVVV